MAQELLSSDEEQVRSSCRLGCALAFGAFAAVDVCLALLEANHLPLIARDSAVLLAWMMLFAGIPATLFFLLVGVMMQARPSGADPSASAAGVVLGVLVVGGLAVAVADPGAGPTYLRQHLLLGLFLVALMVWRLRLQARRPRVMAILWLTGVLAAGGFSAWGGHTRLGAAEIVAPAPMAPLPRAESHRVMLVGVDGMCWETLRRFAAHDENEDYVWLSERVSMGPLRTLVPTESPRIWSSVATGTNPAQHGVLSFTHRRIPGMRASLQILPRFQGAFLWAEALETLGVSESLPITGRQLQRPPFWEIATASGRDAHVVGWWASWPANPLAGTLVSDKYYFQREMEWNPDTPIEGLVWPPEEGQRLAPLRHDAERLAPEALRRFSDLDEPGIAAALDQPWSHHSIISELPHAYAMDETYFDIAERRLAEAGPDALFAFYFRGLDLVSHAGMRYSDLYEQPLGEDRAYGPVVRRYYAYVLERLRRLVESAGEDARVVVVSDHGFERLEGGDFGHESAPPGVWMAAGDPGLEVEVPASVLDVAPTVLWLAGWPVARDMPGRPWRELFPDLAAAEGEEPARCASYGRRGSADLPLPDDVDGADAEMMERLRSLGYLN